MDALEARTYAAESQLEMLQETLLALEMTMAAENTGWLNLLGTTDLEFSRDALRRINHDARLYWLKNPLIRRGVDIQAKYVFGQGMTVRAPDPEVNEVIQAFMDDAKNKDELTGHQARMAKEVDQRLFGNTFFIFFVNKAKGTVRVRTLPVDEVLEIVCNPEDSKEVWFYKRAWQQMALDGTASLHKTAYPDWRYTPTARPSSLGDYTVDWEHPVYHVKTGGLSDMRFGVSEVYPAMDWAKAYKAFLEDWSTLTRAYSRFAHVMSLPANSQIAGAKAKLNTTLGTGSGETNPPPTVGSTFIGGPGTKLEPMRIGGANVSSDDGRRLLLMVAAALGLPETFFGDSSVGTLATATSLDRPTELQMIDRQTFWAEVHQDIFQFVILVAVKYGKILSGTVEDQDDGTPLIALRPLTDAPAEVVDEDEEQERDTSVIVEFPPLLEHDVAAQINAITEAATLGGSTMADTLDGQTVSRLLLQALGVDDVDAAMDIIYPKDEDGELIPPEPEPTPVVVVAPTAPGEAPVEDEEVPIDTPAVESMLPSVVEFAAAIREVRQVLGRTRDR